jgi:hypothetical protein
MSKNLTRKSLAIGATLALASAAVVSAPAQAAGEVVFEPQAGTGYSTFTTLDFALIASLAPGQVAANITQLKYQIVGAAAGDFEYTVGAAVAAAATATNAASQVVSAGAVVGTANVLNIGLAAAAQANAATTTSSVTITAFIDSDNDNTVDAAEYQQARTVTFVKPSEVTATTTFTKPILGGNTFTATVALSGDINARQAAAGVSVEFFKAGVSIADTDDNANSGAPVLTPAQRTNPIVTSWDTTDNVLKAVLYAEADVANLDANYTAYSVTAGTFSAQALLAGTASGSAAIQTAAAATIDNISVAATASADAKSTTTGVRDVSANTTTAGAATVRTAKSVTVVATFLQADDSVVANEPVVLTTTGSNITADTVTVNGTEVDDAAKTHNLTTNASGKITLEVVTSTSDATDTLTLSFALQGVISSNYVITWNDATYEVYNLLNTLDADVALLSGGSLSVDYLVADQWGQGISGDYRLNITRAGNQGRTTAASWNYTPVLTNGRATFTIVDNGAGASSTGDTVSIAVEKAVVGGGYAAQAITANLYDEFVINYVATAPAAGAVSAAATVTTPALETKAVAAANLYFEQKAAPGYADVTHVYGTVTKADGSALPGAVVTLTAAGLGFQPVVANGAGNAAELDKIFTVGSLTVVANGAGQYEALVYSNTTGKKTVSVASHGATKTIDLTFAAADDNAGTSLTIDAPANVKPGSTVKLTVKLVDKYGNPVPATDTADANDAAADFKVTYTGPGLIVGSLPDALESDGTATVNVLLGSNDTGTISLVASYDQDGDNNYTDSTDLSVTKTVTVGAATEVVIGSYSGRVAVRVEGQQGARLSVKVGNKWYVATVPSNRYVWSVKSRKGAVVKVSAYLNGDLENTSTITVK